jgi:hypothetical protein
VLTAAPAARAAAATTVIIRFLMGALLVDSGFVPEPAPERYDGSPAARR